LSVVARTRIGLANEEAFGTDKENSTVRAILFNPVLTEGHPQRQPDDSDNDCEHYSTWDKRAFLISHNFLLGPYPNSSSSFLLSASASRQVKNRLGSKPYCQF
jgi:hypothetical protein